MAYYPEQTHVLPLATILRERRLSVPGEVVVRQGASVIAADVVARAAASSRHEIIDVASALRVAPDNASDYLLVDEGDSVDKGQVIAERRRFLGKATVTAPIDGIVALVERGRVVLESAPESIELKAAMSGSVAAVLPRYGVQIQTVGALIQGVWGSGGVESGGLRVCSDEVEGELEPSAIRFDHGGAIIVSRVPLSAEAMDAAVEQRVRGIIAPAMRASLIEKATALETTSIVLTEGFGLRVMSDAIFNLLQDHDGREAVLIATEVERWQRNRPEIIIPLLSPSELPTTPRVGDPVRVGARVRLLRAPYAGLVGVVSALPLRPGVVESGLKVHGALVDLGAGRIVFAPLANLELLG